MGILKNFQNLARYEKMEDYIHNNIRCLLGPQINPKNFYYICMEINEYRYIHFNIWDWLIYQDIANIAMQDGEPHIHLVCLMKDNNRLEQLFSSKKERVTSGHSLFFLNNIVICVTKNNYELKDSELPGTWQFDWDLLVTTKWYN